jgi:hypothetical protein
MINFLEILQAAIVMCGTNPDPICVAEMTQCLTEQVVRGVDLDFSSEVCIEIMDNTLVTVVKYEK